MNTAVTKDTIFISGNGMSVQLTDVVDRINTYLGDENEYTLDVGTDSQTNLTTKFVTAIVICKPGRGGIFFYRPLVFEKMPRLRDRIYTETTLSINCSSELINLFLDSGILRDVTIHCDVGPNGKTRELIREIVGYVTAYGFDCKIKPETTLACCVADKYSK